MSSDRVSSESSPSTALRIYITCLCASSQVEATKRLTIPDSSSLLSVNVHLMISDSSRLSLSRFTMRCIVSRFLCCSCPRCPCPGRTKRASTVQLVQAHQRRALLRPLVRACAVERDGKVTSCRASHGLSANGGLLIPTTFRCNRLIATRLSGSNARHVDTASTSSNARALEASASPAWWTTFTCSTRPLSDDNSRFSIYRAAAIGQVLAAAAHKKTRGNDTCTLSTSRST